MPLTGVIRSWIEASVSHPLGLNIMLLKVDVGGLEVVLLAQIGGRLRFSKGSGTDLKKSQSSSFALKLQ
jgi:hypothetical protein